MVWTQYISHWDIFLENYIYMYVLWIRKGSRRVQRNDERNDEFYETNYIDLNESVPRQCEYCQDLG